MFVRSPLALMLVVLAAPLQAQSAPPRTAVGQPSIANKQLARDVWNMMQLIHRAVTSKDGCRDAPKLGARVIAEAPADTKRPTAWVEHWTVTSCEKETVYGVSFTPEGRGTTFAIRPPAPATPPQDSVPPPAEP